MSGMGIAPPSKIDDFRKTKGQLVDVRSPAEFAQGHWPGAINIPIFSNEQRAKIGTTYKQDDREKAILLGIQYVGGSIQRIREDLKRLSKHKNKTILFNCSNQLRVYCWRGGMRSSSFAWLADLFEDIQIVLLEGGYKSYRHWVLETFDKKLPIKLLGGRTGTGKTDLLKQFEQKGIPTIDLEGLAHHRGSSFGGLGLPKQPTNEHYENKLAEALQISKANSAKEIWLEAESANLGTCRIPQALFNQMKIAPVVEIKRSLNERLNQLVNVYSLNEPKQLTEATLRISRRLGPQRTQQAIKAIENRNWSEACMAMLDYYDRCYDDELKRSAQRQSIDLTGLSIEESCKKMIDQKVVSA